MDPKVMAENILRRMRDDQERIRALDTVLTRRLNPAGMKRLREEIESEISRFRNDPSYRKYVVQAEQDIADATTDAAVISVLHSEGLAQQSIDPI